MATHLDEDGRAALSDYIAKRYQQDSYRLTWLGHEFLDTAKNDTIWKKVVARFQNEGVGMAFELAKLMLFAEAKKHLRLE
jgi:hypothetical protein